SHQHGARLGGRRAGADQGARRKAHYGGRARRVRQGAASAAGTDRDGQCRAVPASRLRLGSYPRPHGSARRRQYCRLGGRKTAADPGGGNALQVLECVSLAAAASPPAALTRSGARVSVKRMRASQFAAIVAFAIGLCGAGALAQTVPPKANQPEEVREPPAPTPERQARPSGDDARNAILGAWNFLTPTIIASATSPSGPNLLRAAGGSRSTRAAPTCFRRPTFPDGHLI